MPRSEAAECLADQFNQLRAELSRLERMDAAVAAAWRLYVTKQLACATGAVLAAAELRARAG